MLQLFRTNSIFPGFLLLLLCVGLRLPSLLQLLPYEYIQTAPLSRILFPYLASIHNHLLWGEIISLLLVYLQAILLNYIVSQHGILYKDTFLPGLFFVLLNSFYTEQSQLTPQLISNTFIILLLQRLCFLYESQNPLLLVFDAGMYLGLGILFNYDLSIFLPFILISVVIFTSFNVRYLLISIIGIMVPLYFTVTAFYFNDNFDELIFYVRQSFEKQLLHTFNTTLTQFVPWLVLLPIVLISGFELQQNFFRNKVKTRRIIQSVGLMLLFGVLSLFIENTNFIYALCYLSVPMSIITAYYFISDKRFVIKESVVIGLIALAVYYKIK